MYLYSAYAPQLGAHLNLLAINTSLIGMIGNLGMAFSGPIAGVIVDSYGISIPLSIGGVNTFLGYSLVRYCYLAGWSSVSVLCFALLLVGSGSSFVFSSLVKCAALNYPESRGFSTSVPLGAFGLSALFFSSIYRYLPIDRDAHDDQEKLLSVLCFVPAIIYIMIFYFCRVRQSQLTKRHDVIELESIGVNGKHDHQVDIHGTHLIKSHLFWHLFCIMGLLAGIGQMYIYSCGYVIRALVINEAVGMVTTDGDQSPALDTLNSKISALQSVQVGLISFTSFSGRMLSGIGSDYVYARGKPRAILLLVACIILLIAQIAGKMVSTPSVLWVVSGLTGLSYGVTFGTFPTIVSDCFGMKHFSQNWGLLALSPVPASYFFNMLFGRVYDGHSVQGQCTLGAGCYSLLFNLTTCLCFFALIMIWGVIRST